MNKSMAERLIIGAMSGTSADGVDAALVGLEGRADAPRLRLLGFQSVSFPEPTRATIVEIRAQQSASFVVLCALAREIAELYADAVNTVLAEVGTRPDRVVAIAAHGQTLFHAPGSDPQLGVPTLTYQLFDPALLAWRTGIDVISDFRRADCAAGGQGAPLVPFADYAMFASPTEARVIVNLGGIANVTILPAGGTIGEVTGFDVGPANCLSDWLMNGAVDQNGKLALSGEPSLEIVEKFLGNDYVRRPPPKSTDGPEMIALYQLARLGKTLSLPDKLATAAMIVAESILRQTPEKSALIVAGGGVHNRAVMDRLRTERSVHTTDVLGIPAQAREAMAFAILGAATLDRIPANLPRVTGASRPVVLGAITPKP